MTFLLHENIAILKGGVSRNIEILGGGQRIGSMSRDRDGFHTE